MWARTSLLAWRRSRERVAMDFSPLFAFQEDMDRLFGESWQGFEGAPAFQEAATWTPRVTLSKTDSELRVEAELPGLGDKDFEVSLEGASLTLKGEKRRDHEGKAAERGHVARTYGRFERTIELPCEVDADKVSASYKDGVLRVTLPKLDPAKRGARQIEVRTS